MCKGWTNVRTSLMHTSPSSPHTLSLSLPLCHPPPHTPSLSPLPQISLEGGAGVLAPASSEETLALPSTTQPNTELKNVCSPEHMQVRGVVQLVFEEEDPPSHDLSRQFSTSSSHTPHDGQSAPPPPS